MVNEEAEGVAELRARITRLESALRTFVHPSQGYSSGVRRGVRWCAPKVTADDMQAAREALPEA